MYWLVAVPQETSGVTCCRQMSGAFRKNSDFGVSPQALAAVMCITCAGAALQQTTGLNVVGSEWCFVENRALSGSW